MTLIEMGTRGWAVGPSEAHCRGGQGGPLSVCTNLRSKPMYSLRSPKMLISPPKHLGTSRHCAYPGWQLIPCSNSLDYRKESCPPTHSDVIWATHFMNRGTQRPIPMNVSYGSKPAAPCLSMVAQSPRQGRRGAGRGSSPAPPLWDACRPSRALLCLALRHCNGTVLGWPAR